MARDSIGFFFFFILPGTFLFACEESIIKLHSERSYYVQPVGTLRYFNRGRRHACYNNCYVLRYGTNTNFLFTIHLMLNTLY